MCWACLSLHLAQQWCCPFPPQHPLLDARVQVPIVDMRSAANAWDFAARQFAMPHVQAVCCMCVWCESVTIGCEDCTPGACTVGQQCLGQRCILWWVL